MSTTNVYVVVNGTPSEEEDMEVPGAYLVEIEADNEEDFCPREVAADAFHDNIAIACLDDFDITYVAENGMELEGSDDEHTADVEVTFLGPVDPATVPRPGSEPAAGTV